MGNEARAKGPLTDKVLAFVETMTGIVPLAKGPGFTSAGWAPLEEFVAVDDFVRVGCWLETMNWQEYLDMITQWGTSTDFESIQRRVTEVDDRVYLELEEHNTKDGKGDAIRSLSIYEFNSEGKIHHLDVYLQRPLAPVPD